MQGESVMIELAHTCSNSVLKTGRNASLGTNWQEGKLKEKDWVVTWHEKAAFIVSGFVVFLSFPLQWNISVPNLE